jgi:cyanate permease
VFGAAFGPKLSGIAYDRMESYVVAFVGAAAFYLVTAALIFMTRPRFLAASKRNAEKTAPTTAEQDAPA